jgi:peptidoglycan hydrolase FlgJ
MATPIGPMSGPNTGLPLDPLARARQPTAAPEATEQEKETARAFEAVFLSQFVGQMMETVDAEAMGGGKQAEMWRSFLSDAVAESIVDQGGLGIATSIEQMLAAYRK